MRGAGILSAEDCATLTGRVLELVSANRAQVTVRSETIASSEFARGDSHMAREGNWLEVGLSLELSGRQAWAGTNQVDDAGLRSLVATAEGAARENHTPGELSMLPQQTYPEGPQIHFEANIAAMAGDAHATLVHRASEAAEAAGLVAAGEVRLVAGARAVRNTRGLLGYQATTYGEFSITARSLAHRGSGWAWSGYEDWDRVDTDAVIARAIGLGERSADPVAIEPGRYTVILEPAAVATLLDRIIGQPTRYWSAGFADTGGGVFAKEPLGTNKIGLQMMDRRLGMVSSPWDPERPASTIGGDWAPVPGPVSWFEDGILRNLAYHPTYARRHGREPVVNPGGVRLVAGDGEQSLDEMIASTRRGIWVNRLSHTSVLDERTLLMAGTTRDGTFLIENGRITRPIMNLRFTESPFFVFNQLEAWGETIRASQEVVAPRLKVRDFNFSSLTDAI